MLMDELSAHQHKIAFRVLALAIIAMGVVVSYQLYPASERFVLHPDDHNAYIFGREVLRHGTPAIPYVRLDPTNVTPYPVFAPVGSRLNTEGQVVTSGAPGIYYLLAPVAWSFEASLAYIQVACAVSLFVFYLYLERHFPGWAAIVGLAALAGSASVLFWGSFLMPNAPAVGLLFGGLLLVDGVRPTRKFAGGFLVVLSAIFRFEYLILVMTLGIGWLVSMRHSWRTTPITAWALLGGMSAGALLLGALSWILYGTANVIAVSRNTPTAFDETLTGTIANTGISVFQGSFLNFTPFVMVFGLACICIPFLERRGGQTHLPLVVGVFGMMAYILFTGFSPQVFFMSHSYTRYVLPLVAVGSLGIALAWNSAPRWTRVALAATVVLTITASIVIVAGPDGFGTAREIEHRALQERAFADLLPADAILIGDQQSKWVDSRQTLAPSAIPVETRDAILHDIVFRMLASGHHLYVSRSTLSFEGRDQLLAQSDLAFEETADHHFWRILLKPTAGDKT